jgi:hypothetical protein
MTKQDKIAILFGWGLNTLVVSITAFAVVNYIA